MPKLRRHRDRSKSAATAVGLLCLLAAGQLAGLVHEAEVRHVTCAEHGELVHAGLREDVREQASPSPPGYRQGHGASTEHEHCGARYDRRDPALLGEYPAVVRLAAASSVPAPNTSVTARFARPSPRRVAPKGSPPLRG